jgi:hypothetical protein
MSSVTRFPTRLLVFAATIGSLTALSLAVAPSGLASESSERSGHLHITKECSQYTRLADSFCTIISSNLDAIAAGSRVVYFQPAGATAINSDVAIVVGPGNYALGHVYLPFPAGPGTVNISGGTGGLTQFQANIVVTRDFAIPRAWFWDGTYSFGERDDSVDSAGGDHHLRGALHVTKECSENTGLADTFCTITASNLSAIKAGSRVVYLQDSGIAVLDSDVILVVGPGNLALGHCTVNNLTNLGICTFSGGRGTLDGFRARVNVSSNDPLGIVFQWDGTYRFSHDD